MKRTLTTVFAALMGAFLAFAQPPQGPPPGGFGQGGPGRQGGFGQGAPGRQGGFQFRAPEKPSDPSFETKDINIQSRGKNLYGVACIPKGGPAKKPTVIMSHGFGGSGTGFYGQMAELAKQGFVTYAIDFQGGGRGPSQSEGSTREMSIFTEKQNLLDIIAEIRTWDCVDTNNLFLLGESQGGCVSAITAPEIKDQIKALCLIYPALCIPDDAIAQYKTVADIPAEMNFMGMDLGKAYYEKILDYDIYSVIAGYQKDILLVHGTNDQVVKISYSDKASKIYQNCEYHIIEGAGHGFFGEQKTKSDQWVLDFLKKEIAK